MNWLKSVKEIKGTSHFMRMGVLKLKDDLPNSDLTCRTTQCMNCRFIIGREKPGEQSEVAQLIQQTLEQERWQREMMEQRYNQYMEEDEEVRSHTTTQNRLTH